MRVITVLCRPSIILRTSLLFKAMSSRATQDYCVDLVRKYDHENYLSTLLLRRTHGQVAFAFRAFNIEVANVELQAKEERLQQMRLKFWEDTVEKILSNKPPDHPVAIEVHKVLRKNALSKNHLLRLVTSRARKISFQNMDEMVQYAENTTSSIYYLQLLSLGFQDLRTDHAFSHLGKGQGLTNLLRSVPYHAQRHVVILPQESLIKHKVSHEAVIRGRYDETLRDVVFEVASLAHQHLGQAGSMICQVHPLVHKHFLPICPLLGYLERLRKVDFDVFHPCLQRRDFNLPLKLLWRSWYGF